MNPPPPALAPFQSGKRLKSSEPDFQVTCKCDDKEKTFDCHSFALARNSKYFDSLIVSNMSESTNKSVTLEDVSPDVFELALEIVEDPSKARKVTAPEILKVVEFYNRFEFTSGLKVAEDALTIFLEKWIKNRKKRNPTPEQMGMIIKTMLFAEEANLQKLIQISIEFVKEKLHFNQRNTEWSVFTQVNLERMQSFLVKHPECLEKYFSEHNWSALAGHRPSVDAPYFPPLVAEHFQRRSMYESVLKKCDVKLRCTFRVTNPSGTRTNNHTILLKMRYSGGPEVFMFQLEDNHSVFNGVSVFHNWYVTGPHFGTKYNIFDWFIAVSGQERERPFYSNLVFPNTSQLQFPPTGTSNNSCWICLNPPGEENMSTVSVVGMQLVWNNS